MSGSREELVVVGNGMAGMACLEQILRYEPNYRVTVFGDETHVNYNRIQLSSVLAGEKDAGDIVLNGLEWYIERSIDLRLGVRVTGVDAANRTVTADDGTVTRYDKLLLATGSSALIPAISGAGKDGVFCFRNLGDTHAMLDRVRPGLKTVVIGGGLLGLEAARGLQLRGADVTVVHLMSTLMERQLDAAGGRYLQEKIEELGVKILLSHSTTAILGDSRVEGISFVNGYRM
ncbi:MAG TPA: FAD-dependent oxidoreductase, partial [Bryobacteraceae bacterium]|nr:FAD-dependent oxidoreductase [Bryobacteraceae bacterium]